MTKRAHTEAARRRRDPRAKKPRPYGKLLADIQRLVRAYRRNRTHLDCIAREYSQSHTPHHD